MFDLTKQVTGYELVSPVQQSPDGEVEASTVSTRGIIHTLLNVVGVDALLEGKTAFIPTSVRNLAQGDYVVLPPGRTVLLLDGAAQQNHELQIPCQEAKRAGFALAVEHSRSAAVPDWLARLVDIVRVNVRTISACHGLVAHCDGVFLASGVDTPEEFARAAKGGFSLVQGQFFCQPDATVRQALNGAETTRLQFLAELGKPDLDFDRLEQIVRSDVALSHHLLRYLNSAAMGIRNQITSIKQGMTMLGERAMRRWGSLVAMACLSSTKPQELMLTSLVRARLCESVGSAQRLQVGALDLYLVGLLSALDAITDVPMQQAVSDLPLAPEVCSVLLGDRTSPLGRTLNLVQASERGAWKTVNELCVQTGLTQREVANLYFDALGWARDQLKPVASPN